jgi:hypothetical protein
MSRRIVIPSSTLAEVEKQAIQLIAKQYLQESLTEEFDRIKEEMIQEFMSHPITEEIMNGINAENTSGTLSNRTGNLFSFIGFDASDDPISQIVNLLEQSNIKFLYSNRKNFIVKMTIPTAESIFAITPMPWAQGRSWAKGIESGISGLGFYLQKFNQGRSEGGIQVDAKISSGKFKNTPYISYLMNKYFQKFTSINYSKIKISKL